MERSILGMILAIALSGCGGGTSGTVENVVEQVDEQVDEQVIIESTWVADPEAYEPNYVVREKKVNENGDFLGVTPSIDHQIPLSPEIHNIRSFELTTPEDYIYKRDNNLLEFNSYHSYNDIREIERSVRNNEWLTNDNTDRISYSSVYIDNTEPLFQISWSVVFDVWQTESQYTLNFKHSTYNGRRGTTIPLSCYYIIKVTEERGICTYYDSDYVLDADFMENIKKLLVSLDQHKNLDKAVLIQNEILKYMGVL
jgi:hypothetical protein